MLKRVRVIISIAMALLFSQCTNGQKKNQIEENRAVPTEMPKNDFVVDTSLNLRELEKLLEYRIKLDTTLHNHSIRVSKIKPVNQDSLFILDSLKFLNQDLFTYMAMKYLKANPLDANNLFLLDFNLDFSTLISIDERLAIFNRFPSNVQKSNHGQRIKKTLIDLKQREEANLEFDLSDLDSFALFDTNNRPVRFSNLAQEGYEKYLIIFGASWCGPCRFENQLLKRRFTMIDTVSVKVIGISLDKDYSKWKKMINEDASPWVVVRSPSNNLTEGIAKHMDVKSLPENFLVKSNGQVLKRSIDLLPLLNKL